MAATFTEIRIPLGNMSFTPDVPSNALTAGEYNSGQNVETDTRGIRAVFGDQEILTAIPGTPIFVTAGYRDNDLWWYIVCSLTTVSTVIQARWYAIDDAGNQINITPGYGSDPTAFLSGYTYDQAITDTWNGTTLFINDNYNAPMYLTATGTEFKQYSQNSNTYVTTGASGTSTVATLTFATQTVAPYKAGDQIVVAGVTPIGYNGYYTVTACTTSSVSYLNTTTGSQTVAGSITANYQWNYTPGWKRVAAGFMHMFSTPNVGSIMIAGNLTADLSNGTTKNYPTTVQWSQSFGLNDGPLTWAPTNTNIANQLEVPVRGPIIDGFPTAGNFYICSYWDTVVFSPITYQGTNYPVLGVRLLTQGRGLLNENCWSNVDKNVYGLDARDIWVFDGNNFKSLGNQRVKNYFYSNLNPTYSQRTFTINNTEKNQFEIYYPDLNSTGWCNKMLAYRYDLDVFQPPRDVDTASHAIEAPLYISGAYKSASRTVTYCRAVADTSKLVEKDQGTSFLGGAPIASSFRRDNINLGLNYSQQALIHRILPEVVNINTSGLQIAGVGNITIGIGGSDSVGSAASITNSVTMPINTSNPWVQANQNALRTYTVQANNVSATNTWQMTGINWQFTPTQDSR
jgi:hypothetical protein